MVSKEVLKELLMKTKFLIPTVLSILLGACMNTNVQQIPSPLILNSESRTNLVDANENTLTFAADTPQATSAMVGTVVVSEPSEAAPDGLLRKVSSVTTDVDGQTVITTEPADLAEVIPNADIEESMVLDASRIKKAVLLQGVTLNKITPQASATFPISLSVNNVTLGTIKGVRISANGSFTYSKTFTVNLNASWGKLNRFEASTTDTITRQVSISATGVADQFNFSKEIANLTFGAFTVWVGLVPVVFTPKVVISLNANGVINGTLTLSTSITNATTRGAVWENNNWRRVESTSITGSASVSAKVKAQVQSNLAASGQLLVYGIVGPRITVKPFVKFDLLAGGPVYGGIGGSFGVDFSFGGVKIGWNSDFPEWQKQIATIR
jgi:hypothetical protein